MKVLHTHRMILYWLPFLPTSIPISWNTMSIDHGKRSYYTTVLWVKQIWSVTLVSVLHSESASEHYQTEFFLGFNMAKGEKKDLFSLMHLRNKDQFVIACWGLSQGGKIKIYRNSTSRYTQQRTKNKDFNSYLCIGVHFNIMNLGIFPVALIKYTDKSSPKEKGSKERREIKRGKREKLVYLGSQFESNFLVTGTQGSDECCCPTLTLLFSLGTQPQGIIPPTFRVGFPISI